jgi:CheY-like chemotaxis protein
MCSILLIEDDADVRSSLRGILEGAGHEVTDAVNGLEGFRRYRVRPSDVIITDMYMPEQGGLETIISIRREFPDVKIIAISGDIEQAGHSELRMARVMGAQVALEKPVQGKELLEAVHKLAKRK